MKRWQTIALAGGLVVGTGYVITHRPQLGLTGQPATEWQKVDRTADGFNVQMPADTKEIQIPAYNEGGETDKVNMIFSNPDAETTYSVAWEDDPPVARVSKDAPDRTLDAARDGAVVRTQTTLVNESTTNIQGFPGREFTARNAGGGVLNARLIYAGPRLYMLTAVFPSMSARRDQDVSRFFNSFVITGASENAQNSPKAD